MTEERRKLPTNSLTVEELLRNKGIKCNAWDEYERSAKTLPKTGMKQFEPDDSWLQNMQIEKGLKSRKNLIAVERVDRISQLASAEWLPLQKRARVKKYSGQDWGNYGLEKNCALYLLPEEALFLLETNCLELIWNDVPLSIQQAYELLIDNVECTLEEYRVYSHLARYGYRIQRFIYNTDKNMKSEESNNVKRKVIVEPENGLWKQTNTDNDTGNEKDVNDLENISANDSVETCQNLNESVDMNDVHKVMNDLLSAVENIESEKKDTENCKLLAGNASIEKNNQEKRKRTNKVQIISEETLLGSFKIVTDKTSCMQGNNSNNSLSNWRSARIQRNVKLLPKRTDKALLPTPDISVLDTNTKSFDSSLGKHKSSSPSGEEYRSKRLKHEVIELSDDEVEELPQPMSRMEILNLIPNMAAQQTVVVKISRGYIPHSVKPQNNVYHYESRKLRNLHHTDQNLKHSGVKNGNASNSNQSNNTPQYNNASTSNNVRRSTHVATLNHNLATNVHNVFMQDYFSMERRQYTNINTNYMYNSRMPFAYNQNSFWHHRNTVFQNIFIGNHSAAMQNRFMSVQMNNLLVPNLGNNVMRSVVTRNQLHHNFQPNNSVPPRRMYHHRIEENMSIHCSVAKNVSLPEPRQRYWPRNHYRNSTNNNNRSNHNDEVNQAAFKVLPGASSWSELKTKWREEKMITIDDEDICKDEECDEVQVVGRLRSPLCGPKNATSLEEVFSKLKIIKSMPEKTVRRKKSRYKISYNIYSNTQNYRKANPGPPLYRIIVIKQDDLFLQPIELHRLVQDANKSPLMLACVSMSISYIQPGFVCTPNLT
ncbi:tRNA splicing endonuclease subunit 54 [Halictus rubicundus]|uniref:tRNA splicing endonuclease subunit 54 n=1 Tax=Halictus rubicundus TaxID=77578 RepID=UPI0040350B31